MTTAAIILFALFAMATGTAGALRFLPVPPPEDDDVPPTLPVWPAGITFHSRDR
jgi:hypothetical protein